MRKRDMSRHTWFYGLIVFLLFGCGSAPIECPDLGDCSEMQNEQPTPVQIVGAMPQSAGNAITPGTNENVVFQTKFPTAGVYTLQFGIDDPNLTNVVNGEVVRAQAEITWSVAGQNIRRLVDCVNGLSISGEAEAVDVKITDRSIITVPKKAYVVQVTVAPGTRPAVEQAPQYTGDVVRLDAGGGGQISVPAGAISVMVVIAPLVIGSTIVPDQHIVRQAANGGFTLRSYSPVRFPGWIPLANGCTKILYEQSALQTDDFNYFAAFGIDG